MNLKPWQLIAGAVVLGGLFFMSNRAPRGIRNNNPLNIREAEGGGDQWQGEAPGDWDPDFEEFTDPVYGFRAATRVIRSYQRRGLTTLEQIISTWAPATENKTGAYIEAVAARLGVDPEHRITDEDLPGLLGAMTHHENGENPYSLELIEKGVALA